MSLNGDHDHDHNILFGGKDFRDSYKDIDSVFLNCMDEESVKMFWEKLKENIKIRWVGLMDKIYI